METSPVPGTAGRAETLLSSSPALAAETIADLAVECDG